MEDVLRAVPLFTDLSEADLARLAQSTSMESLSAGETLFEEGDEGDHAYIVTAGELEIVKTADQREVLLAVIRDGAVVGEMALLTAAPRNATARAREHSELIQIPKAALDELLDSSASAARALFQVYLGRWQETDQQLRQSERLALSAGLAHELNNPAAAVARSAAQLTEGLSSYDDARTALLAEGFTADQQRALDSALDAATGGDPNALSALARGDLEDELNDWLEDAGVERAWEIAPALVEAGLTLDAVRDLQQSLGDEHLGGALTALTHGTSLRRGIAEIEEGARRLSEIVRAMKSYSYMDRGDMQSVDITQGIDDTLTILKRKLEGIEIVREYEDGLPEIEGFGGELNQVWTNLIDNAAYAIQDADGADGRITIRAVVVDGMVDVQVEDNGKGIAPEAQQRIFDSFFTTKPVGVGTGLGLDISYRIVVHKHQGSLRLLSSEPGRTVFQVELPLHPAPSGEPDPSEE
jgi:signal transduction histidine kinase